MWQSHLAGCTHSLRRSCKSHKCCSAPQRFHGDHSAALFYAKAAACQGCLPKDCIRGVHCRRVCEAFGLPPFLEGEEQHQPEEPSAEPEEAASPAAAVQRAEDAINVLQVGVGHVRHARWPISGLEAPHASLGHTAWISDQLQRPDILLAAADLSRVSWDLAPRSVPPVSSAGCLTSPADTHGLDMPQRPTVDNTWTV